LLVLVAMSVRILSYRSLKGTVTTLILAPVSRWNSGARRWSGSAICGPVKVRTLTETPSCAFAPVFFVDCELPLLQAATNSASTAMDAAHPWNRRLVMLSPSHARSDSRAHVWQGLTVGQQTSNVYLGLLAANFLKQGRICQDRRMTMRRTRRWAVCVTG